MSGSGRGVRARSIRVAAVPAFVVLAACGGSSDAIQPSAATLDAVATSTTSTTSPPATSAEPQASLPGDGDGDGGVALVAVDPVDGSSRWTAGDAGLVSVRAVLPLSDVVVGLGSDCRGNNVEAAWDRATGSELWRSDVWSPPDSGVPNADVRSIQLGEIDGTIAIVRPDAVLGVEPSSGTIRWTFASDGGSVIGLSAAADVFVVATLDTSGGLTYQGLDPATGESRWSTALDHGRFDGAFAVGDRIVVIPGYDATGAVMLALDADDGTTRWEAPAAAGSDRGLPAIAPSDVVVVVRSVGSAAVGLDPATGAQLWQLSDDYWLPGQSSSSEENGALLKAPAVHVVSSEGVALVDSQQGGLVWSTTWDEQNAAYSSGFIGTTVDGDALFGHPSRAEVSQGALTLLGMSGETIWETDIFEVPANPADVIADRSDVFVLSHCGGN